MDRAGPAAHNPGGPTTRGRAAPVATRMGHARRTEESTRASPLASCSKRVCTLSYAFLVPSLVFVRARVASLGLGPHTVGCSCPMSWRDLFGSSYTPGPRVTLDEAHRNGILRRFFYDFFGPLLAAGATAGCSSDTRHEAKQSVVASKQRSCPLSQPAKPHYTGNLGMSARAVSDAALYGHSCNADELKNLAPRLFSDSRRRLRHGAASKADKTVSRARGAAQSLSRLIRS